MDGALPFDREEKKHASYDARQSRRQGRDHRPLTSGSSSRCPSVSSTAMAMAPACGPVAIADSPAAPVLLPDEPKEGAVDEALRATQIDQIRENPAPRIPSTGRLRACSATGGEVPGRALARGGRNGLPSLIIYSEEGGRDVRVAT
jgi:hypothetical protein